MTNNKNCNNSTLGVILTAEQIGLLTALSSSIELVRKTELEWQSAATSQQSCQKGLDAATADKEKIEGRLRQVQESSSSLEVKINTNTQEIEELNEQIILKIRPSIQTTLANIEIAKQGRVTKAIADYKAAKKTYEGSHNAQQKGALDKRRRELVGVLIAEGRFPAKEAEDNHDKAPNSSRRKVTAAFRHKQAAEKEKAASYSMVQRVLSDIELGKKNEVAAAITSYNALPPGTRAAEYNNLIQVLITAGSLSVKNSYQPWKNGDFKAAIAAKESALSTDQQNLDKLTTETRKIDTELVAAEAEVTQANGALAKATGKKKNLSSQWEEQHQACRAASSAVLADSVLPVF